MDPLELNKEQENATAQVNETEKIVEEQAQPQVEETIEVAEKVAVVVEEQPDVVVEKAVVAVDVEVVESTQVADAQKETAPKAPEKPDYNTFDRAGLIQELTSLLQKEVDEIKEDVEQIKQVFYKKLKAEIEEQKKLFIEGGGEDAEFTLDKDELEEKMKSLMGDFRAKKAANAARIEQERENNLIQKQHILEQMKNLTETTDDVSSHIGEFKDLQQRWKAIGSVGASVSADLWKQYNLLQEKFWDLIKINNELREYDFKKNLEAKILLCEAAEKLIDETDVISASRQLQKFHEDWREIGPVARDMREETWSRFKEATTTINKKHQGYFEELRKSEGENLELKSALCEKIEALDFSELKTYVAWDNATQTIIGYQEEWRSIGFAPRKANQKVFERYRKACDAFFSAKNAFYKDVKTEMAENLEKKRVLCEKAEALKDSTDWKETGEQLIKIQKEWKEIGSVPKKYSDELWKRFIAACDYFFEQKNKQVSDQRAEEVENLKKKQDIIVRIDALKADDAQKSYAELKDLIEEWRNVGHVPFKEKDKAYKQYRAAIDKQFDALNVDATNRRLETFRSNLEDISSKGDQKLYREREKLVRTYEHLKSEIATYENNMGFLTAKSKSAGGIIKEMESKIEKLKDECKLIEQKINMIEDKM